MYNYLPIIAVISVIVITILFSIEYTLCMILREIRSIRIKLPYGTMLREEKREREGASVSFSARRRGESGDEEQ